MERAEEGVTLKKSHLKGAAFDALLSNRCSQSGGRLVSSRRSSRKENGCFAPENVTTDNRPQILAQNLVDITTHCGVYMLRVLCIDRRGLTGYSIALPVLRQCAHFHGMCSITMHAAHDYFLLMASKTKMVRLEQDACRVGRWAVFGSTTSASSEYLSMCSTTAFLKHLCQGYSVEGRRRDYPLYTSAVGQFYWAVACLA